jgi:hypothetical protein
LLRLAVRVPLGYLISLAAGLGLMYLANSAGFPVAGGWIYVPLGIQALIFTVWMRYAVLRRKLAPFGIISCAAGCAALTFILILTLFIAAWGSA